MKRMIVGCLVALCVGCGVEDEPQTQAASQKQAVSEQPPAAPPQPPPNMIPQDPMPVIPVDLPRP